jgi:putative transposase
MSERYRRGAHTIYDVKYHFVWKTKYGYAVLKGNMALRTRQIIREICELKELKIVSGNVRANPIHLLVSSPTDKGV